jgi:hypothetical protein
MSTRFECRAVASFLDAGRTMANAGHAAATVAGIGLLLPCLNQAKFALAVALVMWAVVCCMAIRVRIDASLFRAMADAPDSDPDRLDMLLAQWGFSSRCRRRTIAERSKGAIRLLRWLAAALILQLGALIAGILLTWMEV